MDIVKKLNPFKRLHAQAPVYVDSVEVSGELGVHRQTQAVLPRSGFTRDSERKRNARAAATEKELIHLNHKIVSTLLAWLLFHRSRRLSWQLIRQFSGANIYHIKRILCHQTLSISLLKLYRFQLFN